MNVLRLIGVAVMWIPLAACTPEALAVKYCSHVLEGSPAMTVSVQEDAYQVRHTQSREELSRRLNSGDTSVASGQALGVATATYQQSIRVTTGEFTRGPGFVCGVPNVEVVLKVAAPVVDLAVEFPVGSCRYGEVLAHELRHVAAYRAHLEDSKAILLAKMAQHFETRPLYLAGSQEDLQRMLEQEAHSWLAPQISELLEQGHRRHDEIDTPEEYLRLTEACESEPL